MVDWQADWQAADSRHVGAMIRWFDQYLPGRLAARVDYETITVRGYWALFSRPVFLNASSSAVG